MRCCMLSFYNGDEVCSVDVTGWRKRKVSGKILGYI